MITVGRKQVRILSTLANPWDSSKPMRSGSTPNNRSSGPAMQTRFRSPARLSDSADGGQFQGRCAAQRPSHDDQRTGKPVFGFQVSVKSKIRRQSAIMAETVGLPSEQP